MAAQVPDMNYPAPGAGGLPLPRTVVEAMAMLAYSRQSGVVAFWARSPQVPDDRDSVTMHWPTEDSSHLVIRKGENRCILIARCKTNTPFPCLHCPLLTLSLVYRFAAAWARARTCTRI